MWQTKYASAILKNLGVGVDFRPCSEGDFLTRRPQSVVFRGVLTASSSAQLSKLLRNHFKSVDVIQSFKKLFSKTYLDVIQSPQSIFFVLSDVYQTLFALIPSATTSQQSNQRSNRITIQPTPFRNSIQTVKTLYTTYIQVI